jgi:hypothetical protein
MSVSNQLALPGKITYTSGDGPDGIITYNLDVDSGTNMPISAEVFQQGIAAFMAAGDLPIANLSFTFDKQMLLILLSFSDCKGLTFYNFVKPDGTQSLAAVAVDNTGTPIGWDRKKGSFGTSGNTFVGADFVHTSSVSGAKPFIEPDGGFDFAGYIKSLQ